MASLPANATAEDIEDELMFQQTLLHTLDVDAENFEEEHQSITAVLQHLEARLAALNSGSQSGLANLDGFQPSESLYLNAPVQEQRINSKRPYGDLSSPDQPSTAFGKRSRVGTPLSTPGTTTPGSTDSLLGLGQDSDFFGGYSNRHRSSALQRQMQAEQSAARRASQAQQDEEFARSLGGSSPHRPPPPSSSQTVLNSDLTIRRPQPTQHRPVQQLTPTPFFNPTAGPSNSFRSPFADLEPTLNGFSTYSDQVTPASSSGFSTPFPSMNPRGKIHPKVEPGLNLPNPSQMRSSLSGRHPETAIPISSGITSHSQEASSADSDSDVVEISADQFTPRIRNTPATQFSRAQIMPYQQLPSSIPNPVNLFSPQNLNPMGMPGSWPDLLDGTGFPQQPWVPPTQGTNQYGMGSNNNLNAFGLPALANAFDFSAPQSNDLFGQDPSYDSRYDYLYADPKKSAEEIRALLQNIRPDEELPPHLREGTPDAMRFPMFEYQKLGLAWLKQQEESSNKGGILADAMGLGKTIQAIALMVSRKSDDPRCKTTLIIAPVALMKQWELEIKEKVKSGHALAVYKHHGPAKKSYHHLRTYDVVITTFGSLAAELKKKEHWARVLADNPNARPTKKEEMNLIGNHCRWYRVIIDEAQCIKNKDTLSAKAAYQLNAKYRLCMTGTPMMNNVTELFSLIHFCRIRPFNEWTLFRQEIQNPIMKDRFERSRQNAMKKLQGLIRATMLRRTKESKLDGKPLVSLPPRQISRTDVTFSEDEQQFYRALEERVQLQFNKYLKQGTVMKNYANALVLLLRLRQACCHPYLTDRFDPQASIELEPEKMAELAKGLSPQVIEMIKEAAGNFMCPICFDTAENPAIFIPCGHDTCTECFSRLTDPSQGIAAGSDGGVEAKCPECRGKVDPKRIIDFKTFKQVHQPELLKDEEKREDEGQGELEETDSDSNSDDEDSEDETSSLDGFIVSDSDEFDNDEDEKKPEKKSKGKRKSNGKGKGKAKDTGKKSLAQLKKEGMRNKAARKKYFKRLKKDFVTSSKIDQTLALLKEIHQRKPVEKVLVFSQFTSLLDLLEIPIKDEGYDYRRYDGSMTPNERTEAALEFKQIPSCTVMLVSLKAGNAGLNLNCASQVIILDPFWNPFIEEQAIDRAHRIGQMRAVQVHRVLVPGTVEDRIIQMQEKKRELISEALDESAGKNISRLGVQELAFLFGVSSNPGSN